MSAEHSAFDLVSRVARAIANRADRDGLQSLNDAERTVLLCWWAKGIVDNGGFQYFYEGAANSDEVAAAFASAGLAEAAGAFRRSRSVFPRGEPQDDLDTRREWMERNSSATAALFDQLDPVVWAACDRLDDLLADYIRANASAIRLS